MKTSIKIKEPWGDCIDTVKYSKPLDDWYLENPKLDYNFFKLPSLYSFDIKEMQSHISEILKKQNTISVSKNQKGEKFNRYRGLGFYSKANSKSPLEDHFIRKDKNLGIVYADNLHLNDSLPELEEDDFVNTTEIMNNYFKKIFSVFKSKISKASILELRSGGWLGSHVDFPYYKNIRLHAGIFGCENSWYEVNGEKFQIPADGNWYFIDTGKYHSVWNHGLDHRVTLNVNLSSIISDPKTLALSGLL
jgi:hypothetical protein